VSIPCPISVSDSYLKTIKSSFKTLIKLTKSPSLNLKVELHSKVKTYVVAALTLESVSNFWLSQQRHRQLHSITSILSNYYQCPHVSVVSNLCQWFMPQNNQIIIKKQTNKTNKPNPISLSYIIQNPKTKQTHSQKTSKIKFFKHKSKEQPEGNRDKEQDFWFPNP